MTAVVIPGWIRILAVLALVVGTVYSQAAEPAPLPPDEKGASQEEQVASQETDAGGGSPALEARPPKRLRRRESIAYRPTSGTEQRLACALSGRVAGATIRGDSQFIQKIVSVDAEGLVHVATSMGEGTCKIGSLEYSTDVGAIWMTLFDSRHQLSRVDLEQAPVDIHNDNQEDIIELGSMMIHLFFSVAYHVRSAGVGTSWQSKYVCINAKGRKLHMSGKHELIEFAFEGSRRVGVIRSELTIPIRGNIRGHAVRGAIQNEVVSEVYVDTGEIRCLTGNAEGTLKAHGGIFAADVDVDDLHSSLRLLLPGGTPVEPLYSPPAGEAASKKSGTKPLQERP